MPAVANAVLQRLSEGRIAASFSLSRLRNVEVAQLAQALGFHWLFLDLEHSPMEIQTACDIAVAALPTGITPIARVPEMDTQMAARLLDGGVQGIVFPHIDTVEEAEEVVSACRFPPRGRRSMTYGGPALGFEGMPADRAVAELDAQTLVAVMLETPQAIERAEQIAAVDGVDVVMIGAQDLCASMGVPGQIDHPELAAAFERVIAAAGQHGKHAGMGGIYQEALMRRFIEAGVLFLLGGSDISFIEAAARARAAFINGLETRPAASRIISE